MAEERSPISFTTHRPALPPVRAIGRRFSPWDDTYHFVMTRSWGQFFFLSAVAYVVINALFALAYMAVPGSLLNVRQGNFEDAFFFSVQTFGTIGYGAWSPANRSGHLLVALESLAGIFSTALITGMTFARFARPRAKVLFSNRAVVGLRDGVPHLMFRMANWRHNQILEAQLRVILLVQEITREGHEIRRPVEIPLVRDRTALFGLTWIVMHRIDETSMFYGPDAIERLRAIKGEIFLSLNGLDETIGQTVHARYSYALQDIEWNAMFNDVLAISPEGERLIDYSQFHQIHPQEIPPESPKAA